jgi:hypothetical protein
MPTSFDFDQFIADCRSANEAEPSHKLVREVVARGLRYSCSAQGAR